MRETWTFNKKRSRLLAGFLAVLLVCSNVAANVQTVYAFGYRIGEDGSITPDADRDGTGTPDQMGIGTPEGGDYDFHVDIWPKMADDEAEEGKEAEDEASPENWTGEWLQYMYDGQETDHTLGQALLMSGKYADEYGPLDMDLPGTWAGDNDEVMEVYADGTAYVKAPGYVNVTFTYEKPEETNPEESSSEEETATSEETSPANETAASEESGETTAAEESSAAEETTVSEESSSVEETTASEESSSAEETTASEESSSVEETTASEESSSVEETTASEESSSAEETTASEESSQVEGTTASEEKTPSTLATANDASREETGDPEETTPAETETSAPAETETDAAAECPLEDGTVLTWVVRVDTTVPMMLALNDNGYFTFTGSGSINGKTATLTSGGTLTFNGTWPGNIVIDTSGTVYMTGTGGIDASNISASGLRIMGGAQVTMDGDITIQNGVGTEITNRGLEPGNNGKFCVGGGVYIENGKFTLKNGTIKNNKAQRGGGIFVANKNGELVMTGGSVNNNQTVGIDNTPAGKKYAGEGGGIFVYGTATISGGEIKNNTCNSSTDLGGGGLYVNNTGIATLINATITGNIADGWGGGIAGCCHGEMSLVATDGAALYGNTAQGSTRTEKDGTRKTAGNKVDNYDKAKAQGFNGTNTADFYTAGSTIISNYMAGGGSARYSAKYDGNSAVTIKDDEVVKKETTNVGLKANPTQESIDMVPKGVVISGNHSTVHGGGIGCNGGLYFGSKEENTVEFSVLDLNLDAVKQLNGGNPPANQYEFELLYGKDGTPGAVAATAENDSSGKISFSLKNFADTSTYLDSETQITFFLREKMPTHLEANASYDKSLYKLVVTLNKKEDVEKTVKLEHTTGQNFKEIEVKYIKTTYTKSGITVYRVNDRNGNPLRSEEKLEGITTPQFDNYTYTPITFEPEVIKTVSSTIAGTPAPSRTYRFTITALTEGAPMPSPEYVDITVAGDRQETEKFNPISYYVPGTYKYQITENDITDNMIKVDKDTKTVNVTVVVEPETASTLKKTVTYTDSNNKTGDGVANIFDNKFTVAPIEYAPKVTKVITGDRVENDKTFTFDLTAGTFVPADGAELPAETTVTVTGANTGTFKPIKFTKSGEYYFNITERNGTDDGYTYDTVSKELYIKIKYNKDTGKLEPEIIKYNGQEVESASVTNSYDAEPTEYVPQVWKVITGDKTPRLNRQSFTFELTADSTNPEGAVLPTPTTITLTDDGKDGGFGGAFGAIKFEQYGTYNFTITEKTEVIPGYTFDNRKWTLTVDVHDNNHQLYVDNDNTKYVQETTGTTVTDKATFTNTYDVADAHYPVKVEKVITGDDRTNTKKEFTFKLEAAGYNPDGATLPSQTSVTVTDEGTVSFDDITFTKTGSYDFTIKEVNAGEKGYTYDTTVWTLNVIVKDEAGKDQDGNDIRQLVAYPTFLVNGKESTADGAVFTNDYKVQPIDYAPKAKKDVSAVNGESPKLNEQEFTFILSGDAQDGAALPANTTVTVNGKNVGTFDGIHFTKAGTYTFNLKEQAGEIPGYTYDESEWTLTVEVTDIESQLTVTSVTYKNGEAESAGTTEEDIEAAKATFTNDYNVKPTDFQPEVEKLFTGNSDPRPQDYIKTFSFTLDGEQDGVTLPESRKATVTSSYVYGANKGKFDEITFTKAGTYTFTITEDDLDESGYLGYGHDDSVWTLTVVVEDVDSKLEVKNHTYTKAGLVIPSIYATFTNSYHAQPTTYQPKATKQVVGEVIPDRRYFQFTLEAAESNPEGVKWDEHVTNGVDSIGVYGLPDYQISQGNFYPVTFEKAGTYMFNILEENTNAAGYTYDSRLWRLTVDVVDRDGQLEVKSAVYDVTGADGRTVFYTDVEDFTIVGGGAAAQFINEYKPAPTHYAPEVMKLIYGNTMPPKDRTYTFVLEHGFWYPNGVLTDAGAVMPEDPTATVVGVGRGKFNEIEFTKAGTYNFTVREKDEGGVNGYLYDDTTWNVEVTVVDNNGQLVVTNVAYTKQAGSRTENVGPENSGEPLYDTDHILFASFYNEYNVLPTETQLHVTKYVTGSVRPDNNVATFNFRLALIDATTRNGATLPEKQTMTITGSGAPGLLGTADFDPIKFTQAGTYIFEIDEMTGFETDTQTMPGYTYDSSTWKVSVEVEDHNGTLVVTKTEYNHLVNGERVDSSDVPAEEGAVFVNDYDVESAKYAPKVNKEFARSAAARPTEEIFTFTLDTPEGSNYGDDITFSDAETAKEVTVTGAGIAAFADITFNEAGTYEFIISETDSGKAGYTYDPVKWKLTVEVIDTGRQAEDVNKSQLLVNTVSYVQIDTDEPKSGAGMATFTNDYQAEEGGYVPQVEKKLIGADRPTEKTFTFSIVENGYTPPAYALALESGAVMPEKTEVTVTGEGSAFFDEIRFTNAGVYSFLITENKGTDNGYTYDEAVWNLTVTVEDVAGQLTATEVVYESNGTEADRAVFTNDYEVTTTEYAPQVKKTVLGNPLEEEQFNFTMESGEGNDTEGFEFAEGDSGRHVSVNGAGTGTFGGITFKKAGTYTFKVKETSSNSPFWVDDDRTWTLTVVVEDEDGQLAVKSHSYVRDGEDSVTSDTEAEFENEYHGPGDLSISKTVSGNRGEMTRAFNFTVTFTNLKSEPLAGTYEYVGSSTVEGVEAPADGNFSGGVLNITLAHGQKITIKGIPADTRYTVTEAEADTESYQTSVEVNGNSLTDDEAAGEVVRDTETVVEYLNYRNRTPDNPGPGDNPGGGPGDNPGPGPGPEFELITNEPTPLSSFGGLENIEDADTPLAFLAPMTGDERPVGAAALFGLMALGMMGAFGLLAFRKDEKDS